MKRIVVPLIVGLCCVMTACSATPAGSQASATPSSTTVSPTAEVIQPTTGSTITEPLTTEKPTEPPTEEPSNPPAEPSWKQLYIDFINSLDDSAIDGYQLIDIDDDDIPELAAHGVTHIAPSYLCWVYNDELCQGNISFSGFAYFERQNKYLCEQGWTGKGVDAVRCIDGNEAVDLINGEFCTVKGQEYYRWDGVDYASYDAYIVAKNKDFDKSAAQTLNHLQSRSEICKQIEAY